MILAGMKPNRLYKILICVALCVLAVSCRTVGDLESYQVQYASLSQFMEDRGYQSVATSAPRFYYDGAAWKEELLRLIEASEETILVTTFLGNEHFSTDEVWQALKTKADEGVDVYIMLDASSQVQAVPHSSEYVISALPMLKEMGMNVVEYNSMSVSNGMFLPLMFDRDHRKFFVFDSDVCAIGGININHTSMYYPSGRGHVDLMGVVDSSPLALKLSGMFVETYNRYTPDPVSLSDLYKEKEDGDLHHSAYLFDHYYQHKITIPDLFNAFALFAEEELWMVQGYTFLTPSLTRRIEYLVEKGVQVNVVISENGSHDKYNKSALYNALSLIEAGARVYLYDAPDDAFLHQKLTVADNRYISFGSANYNIRSHTISRELNLLYDDEEIARDTMQFVDSLVADSRIVSREEAETWRGLSYWYYHMLMQVWG